MSITKNCLLLGSTDQSDVRETIGEPDPVMPLAQANRIMHILRAPKCDDTTPTTNLTSASHLL